MFKVLGLKFKVRVWFLKTKIYAELSEQAYSKLETLNLKLGTLNFEPDEDNLKSREYIA